MRIKTSSDSNPIYFFIRLDSDEERTILATMFPEFGMEKFSSPYPRPTSLRYRVGKSGKNRWEGSVGWDEFPKAVRVSINAEFQFGEEKGWFVEVELSRGDGISGISRWSHRLEYVQRRKCSSSSANVRQAVCKALREAIESTTLKSIKVK
jgi:hypothetical protein